MATAALRPSVSLVQLVLVGAVVPAAFVAADLWLVQRLNGGRESSEAIAAFVVQIGVLGMLCARLRGPDWLRWVIYGWGFALIDAIELAYIGVDHSGNTAVLLLISLLAAQLGLVIVWGALGTTPARVRWPVAVVLGVLVSTPVIGQEFHYNDDLGLLLLAQAAALVVICGVLRLQGFRIALVARSVQEANQPAVTPKDLAQSQFGIRDVLIWTTSLAIVLAVARILQLLSPARIAALFSREWIVLPAAGVLVAIALVVALWAALGAGPAWLRWLLLLVVALAGGVALAVINWFVNGGPVWYDPNFPGPRREKWNWSMPFFRFLYDNHWEMI
ncbi:MAG TPA: hypothetical protein VFB80_20885, partial [Pirellulaceae bacterium]|nr:hypothetical protein [Pirellulaceae bacterium]